MNIGLRLVFNAAVLRHWGARTIRSTILNPLQWIWLPLLIAVIFSAYLLHSWLTTALFILLCVVFVVFIGAFIFALLTEPELLRSEKYLVEKLAIEHHLGDSKYGDAASAADMIPNDSQSQQRIGRENNDSLK